MSFQGICILSPAKSSKSLLSAIVCDKENIYRCNMYFLILLRKVEIVKTFANEFIVIFSHCHLSTKYYGLYSISYGYIKLNKIIKYSSNHNMT